MVLMNATKRARHSQSYIIKADNRCNGGMKKAGAPTYQGWMRSGHGIPDTRYFARTSKYHMYINPKNGESCVAPSGTTKVLPYRPVYHMNLRRDHRTGL